MLDLREICVLEPAEGNEGCVDADPMSRFGKASSKERRFGYFLGLRFSAMMRKCAGADYSGWACFKMMEVSKLERQSTR